MFANFILVVVQGILFIDNLKILRCATNQDVLLLTTLRYSELETVND